MFRFRKAHFVLSFVLLVAAFAAAQKLVPLTLAVPFAFAVADKDFPADTYTFKAAESRRSMSIRGANTHTDYSIPTMWLRQGYSEPGKDTTKLVFHRFGNDNYLAEIWIHSIATEFPKGKKENELMKGGAKPESITIAVNRKK